jgi:hypothetical protein
MCWYFVKIGANIVVLCRSRGEFLLGWETFKDNLGDMGTVPTRIVC